MPNFSNEQFLSAVRQPIRSLVVDGTRLGDGQTVTRGSLSIGFGGVFGGVAARASNDRGERFGSYAATYFQIINSIKNQIYT